MRPSTETKLTEVAIVLGIVLALVLLLWLSRWRQRRVWKHAPFTIAAMPPNTPGRITGTARPLDPNAILTAPGTGRPCVLYEIRVAEEHTYHGRATHQRQTAARNVLCERGGGPFLLVDATGTATVDPTNADLMLGELRQIQTVEQLGSPGLLTERLMAWHATHPTLKALPFSKLGFVECAVFVEDTVTVTGVGSRTDAGLALASTHEEALTITTDAPPPAA